jgi:hypothetical protein
MCDFRFLFVVIPLVMACTDGKSSDTSDDWENGQVSSVDGGSDADDATDMDEGADDATDMDEGADAGAGADDGIAGDADGSILDADADGDADADADGDTDADGAEDMECTEDAELALYERYIEPLVTDAHPSNCNSCHLSGIDLQMYIQDTPCQSMACMEALEVVDFEDPEASEILSYITIGDPTSDLIDADVMDREYDAFLQWIEWGAECHDTVCGEITEPCSSGTDGTTIPDGVSTPLADCSEADLVDSFETLVQPWHGRCSSCHHVDGTERDHFSEPIPAAFFWFGSEDPTTNAMMTMYNMIGLEMVNLDDPTESTLLTKPLEAFTVQSIEGFGDVMGIDHGGGSKMTVEPAPEDAMLDFVNWIQYYVECRGESAI